MKEARLEKDATVNWLKEMKKGYIRLIVLTLLSKKPYYGYEIMKRCERKPAAPSG